MVNQAQREQVAQQWLNSAHAQQMSPLRARDFAQRILAGVMDDQVQQQLANPPQAMPNPFGALGIPFTMPQMPFMPAMPGFAFPAMPPMPSMASMSAVQLPNIRDLTMQDHAPPFAQITSFPGGFASQRSVSLPGGAAHNQNVSFSGHDGSASFSYSSSSASSSWGGQSGTAAALPTLPPALPNRALPPATGYPRPVPLQSVPETPLQQYGPPSPSFSPDSPNYSPPSPEPVLARPVQQHGPTSPSYSPTSPNYSPTSPQHPAVSTQPILTTHVPVNSQPGFAAPGPLSPGPNSPVIYTPASSHATPAEPAQPQSQNARLTDAFQRRLDEEAYFSSPPGAPGGGAGSSGLLR
ncbi:hypothetical protein LTS10_005880 [Elasticomyces elasticus]|nr:hypothetical protein LTS10_005880 [Elasticomyces elasticus]